MHKSYNVKKMVLWLLLIMTGSFIIAGALFFISGDARSFKPGEALQGKYEKTIDETKTLDMAGLENLIITSMSTDINLITTEEETIRAHLHGGISCSNKNYIPTLTTEANGSNAEIRVEWPKVLTVGYMMSNIKLDVYLPKAYQQDLNLETSSASIRFGELTLRNLNCTSTSGDLRGVMAVTENTHFKSSAGTYEADIRAANAFTMESTSGDFRSGSVETEKFTRISSAGSTDIKSLACTDFNHYSTSGDLKLAVIRSVNSTIETSAGTVRISGENTGEIKIKTNSGDITWLDSNAKTVQVDTSSGKTTLTKLAGALELKSSSGDPTVQFSRLEGKVKIKTTSGRTEVKLPEGSEFDLSCRTNSGDIKVKGFEVAVTGKATEDELTGTVGSSKNTVQIETYSGDILLSSY